jgi:hypothetical protein
MGYLHALLPAGLALASGLELAQAPTAPTPAPGQTSLTALDTDKDGSISRLEARWDPALSAQFPTLDRNGNGALEPAEFARFETLGAESTPGDTSPPRGPGGFAAPPLNSIPPPLGTSEPPTGASPPPMAPTTTPDGSGAQPSDQPPSPR